MLAAIGFCTTLSALNFPPLGGLRLIDGPVSNCSARPYNLSHCLETPALPSDLVLVRTYSSARSPVASCTNATLSLPPPIAQYGSVANRVWRALHGPAAPTHCWSVGTFVPASEADPLLAYVDTERATILLSEKLLALVPAHSAPIVLRNYERLLGMIPTDGTPAAAATIARAFWESLVLEAGPVPKALECVGCIVLLSFGSLALANFGGIAAACYLCGCLSLAASTCAALLQSVLYLVIALLPLIAVIVFDGCKSLCVT